MLFLRVGSRQNVMKEPGEQQQKGTGLALSISPWSLLEGLVITHKLYRDI